VRKREIMKEIGIPPVHLIVLAGGLSTRARGRDSAAPKQFRTVGGQMLFMISVRELLRVPEVVSVTVAVPEPWQAVASTAACAPANPRQELVMAAKSSTIGRYVTNHKNRSFGARAAFS